MKAQMSIDPALISLLGRKLYSSHPLQIIVRELLQNSVDACKNIHPYIRIEVQTKKICKPEEEFFTIITCTDSGCGMSEDVLINKFLCLGGTTKSDGETVGGFGIAKAAIMSGIWWSVHTHDLYVSSKMVMNGADVKKTNYIEGTIVKVVLKGYIYSSDISDMTQMIYGSDVNVHFILKCFHRYGSSINEYEDLYTGLTQRKTFLTSEMAWVGSGVEPIKTPFSTIEGKTFIRFKNLVQFIKSRTYGSERKINLIVDFDSLLSPDKRDFPFSMSRESISNPDINVEVIKWIEQQDSDYMTLEDKFENPEDPCSRIIPGKLLYGNLILAMAEKDPEYALESELSSGKIVFSSTPTIIDQTLSCPVIQLMDYEPSTEREAELDSKYLLMWGDILSLVTPTNIPFGIGLVGRKGVLGAHTENEGVHFLLISPIVWKNHEDKRGLVLKMWARAIHEVAHYFILVHNEKFTSTMGALFSMTCNTILANIAIILRRLS